MLSQDWVARVASIAAPGPMETAQEKSSARRVPPLARALFRLVLAQVLFYAALRAVFYLEFRASGGETTGADLARAFGLGARFDLRLALVVGLPLVALAWIASTRPRWSRAASSVWQAWLVAAG